MTTFEKLSLRIKKDLDIETGYFIRNYVGHWQRSAGAWVWVCSKLTEDGHRSHQDIGSCYPANELIKAKEKLIILRTGEILPNK